MFLLNKSSLHGHRRLSMCTSVCFLRGTFDYCWRGILTGWPLLCWTRLYCYKHCLVVSCFTCLFIYYLH